MPYASAGKGTRRPSPGSSDWDGPSHPRCRARRATCTHSGPPPRSRPTTTRQASRCGAVRGNPRPRSGSPAWTCPRRSSPRWSALPRRRRAHGSSGSSAYRACTTSWSRHSRRATCSRWVSGLARASSRRTGWRVFFRATRASSRRTPSRCHLRPPLRRTRAHRSSGRAPAGRCAASGASTWREVYGTSTSAWICRGRRPCSCAGRSWSCSTSRCSPPAGSGASWSPKAGARACRPSSRRSAPATGCG